MKARLESNFQVLSFTCRPMFWRVNICFFEVEKCSLDLVKNTTHQISEGCLQQWATLCLKCNHYLTDLCEIPNRQMIFNANYFYI